MTPEFCVKLKTFFLKPHIAHKKRRAKTAKDLKAISRSSGELNLAKSYIPLDRIDMCTKKIVAKKDGSSQMGIKKSLCSILVVRMHW